MHDGLSPNPIFNVIVIENFDTDFVNQPQAKYGGVVAG